LICQWTNQDVIHNVEIAKRQYSLFISLIDGISSCLSEDFFMSLLNEVSYCSCKGSFFDEPESRVQLIPWTERGA